MYSIYLDMFGMFILLASYNDIPSQMILYFVRILNFRWSFATLRGSGIFTV